jgi:hypothetical protein
LTKSRGVESGVILPRAWASIKASSRSQLGRQVVPHALDHLEARARHGLAVSSPQASGTSGSAAPWITRVGAAIVRSSGCGRRGGHGQDLARHAAGQ